jgi:hypothetical protein
MKQTLSILTAALVAVGSFSCSNMTPEQQAQWSATANNAAQQASTILLDEAAARLHKNKTSDSKDGSNK